MATTGSGTGTTMTYGSSGAFMLPISISFSGNYEREVIETTTLSTSTARTYIPETLYDPGEITAEVLFDGEITPATHAAATSETITVAWKGSATSWAASGFMTSFTPGEFAVGTLMTGTAVVKLTGAITVDATP